MHRSGLDCESIMEGVHIIIRMFYLQIYPKFE